MKPKILSVAAFVLSALVLWVVRVPKVMASNPSEVVTFVCQDYGSYDVESYNRSSSAPAQTSGATCSDQFEDLLNDGLINVSISQQTYFGSNVTGAPGGVAGTYITFVMANGTLAAGSTL